MKSVLLLVDIFAVQAFLVLQLAAVSRKPMEDHILVTALATKPVRTPAHRAVGAGGDCMSLEDGV